jgi:hypothetical protein
MEPIEISQKGSREMVKRAKIDEAVESRYQLGMEALN